MEGSTIGLTRRTPDSFAIEPNLGYIHSLFSKSPTVLGLFFYGSPREAVVERTFSAQITGAIEAFLTAFTGETKGMFPVDIVLRGRRGDLVIEVFVDGDAGVDTAACAELNRALGAALEAGPLHGEAYSLTVSSPGLDRPLKFPRQYPKHAGRGIALVLRTAGGVERLRGVLVQAGPDSISVRTGPRGEPRVIAYAEIAEAIIETPWQGRTTRKR